MNNKLEIFCVTNKHLSFFDNINYKFAAVGNNEFPSKYIKCDIGSNIYYKEKYYSELTFHYWFWKNMLSSFKNEETWIGFCQKRRFWLQNKKKLKSEDIKSQLLNLVPGEWSNYNAVICEPISLVNPKLIKVFKKGWRNLIKDPSIIYNKKKHSIKLHFDMFHGYGKIDQAIDVMKKKDREEFRSFINESTSFNPHIMFISKPRILNNWFSDVFTWLSDCEEIFGFENLKGYESQRLYAYLSERYLSFWFKKYSNWIEWPYIFIDTEKKEISKKIAF